MDANEIIVYVVQRDGRDVILDFLRESIGQSSESPHRHPHREVLPFHVERADVLHVGITDADDFLRAVAHCRAGGMVRPKQKSHKSAGVYNLSPPT